MSRFLIGSLAWCCCLFAVVAAAASNVCMHIYIYIYIAISFGVRYSWRLKAARHEENVGCAFAIFRCSFAIIILHDMHLCISYARVSPSSIGSVQYPHRLRMQTLLGRVALLGEPGTPTPAEPQTVSQPPIASTSSSEFLDMA